MKEEMGGRKKGKRGKKEEERQRMKEEIWGLEEDTSRWPPLSLLVHGSLQ